MESMSKQTIAEIKQALQTLHDPNSPLLLELSHDPRKGVQNALQQWQRREERYQKALVAFHQRFKFEKQYWQQGCQYVAGMDEVGRGPLAGPVVTCAVSSQ